jgi:homoserine kinase
VIIDVRVPATSANLGPGFDVLGLALGLYNDIAFEEADRVTVTVEGEGADGSPRAPTTWWRERPAWRTRRRDGASRVPPSGA